MDMFQLFKVQMGGFCCPGSDLKASWSLLFTVNTTVNDQFEASFLFLHFVVVYQQVAVLMCVCVAGVCYLRHSQPVVGLLHGLSGVLHRLAWVPCFPVWTQT